MIFDAQKTKKIAISLGIVLFFFCSLFIYASINPPTEREPIYQTMAHVSTESIPVYSDSKENTKVLHRIDPGQEVKYLGIIDGWVEVVLEYNYYENKPTLTGHALLRHIETDELGDIQRAKNKEFYKKARAEQKKSEEHCKTHECPKTLAKILYEWFTE